MKAHNRDDELLSYQTKSYSTRVQATIVSKPGSPTLMRWHLVQAGPTVRASSSGPATVFRLRGYARGRPCDPCTTTSSSYDPQPHSFRLGLKSFLRAVIL